MEKRDIKNKTLLLLLLLKKQQNKIRNMRFLKVLSCGSSQVTHIISIFLDYLQGVLQVGFFSEKLLILKLTKNFYYCILKL